MSKVSITESVTVYLDDFAESDIEKYMENRGYEFIKDSILDDAATDHLIDLLVNHDEYLYQEKENIQSFFQQNKFKSVPHKDLVEFLNKY